MNDRIYQWDINRKIKVDENVQEVHFAIDESHALVTLPIDNIVSIPNVLLQSGNDITVYMVIDNQTVKHSKIRVIKRAKPDDYVYTETEVFTYKALEERIKLLEDNSGSSGGSGVSDVLVNGASIVDKNGNAIIPIAQNMNDVYGLVKLNAYHGVGLKNGYLTFNEASDWYIDNRNTSMMCAITPRNLPYAVKSAMSSVTDEEWTQEEKANARKRMGLGWILIDTMEVSDVEKVDIIFPQEYKEFMVIADVKGDGVMIVTPYGWYNDYKSSWALPFVDFYPQNKDEHIELIFEKMNIENNDYFKISGFESADYAKKMKQNLQTSGWFEYQTTLAEQQKITDYQSVRFTRNITNATFKIFAR